MTEPHALPAGVNPEDLNPDLSALHELAGHFRDRVVPFSYGGSSGYLEIQVGYVRRPAWFPSVSLVTGDSDFSLDSTGNTAGLRARKAQSEFLISVTHQHSDYQQGFAELTDLKWDLIRLAAKAIQGQTYTYLEFGQIETVELDPENPETDLAWGFRGAVLLPGVIHYK